MKIIIGVLFCLLGGVTALLIFFARNHSVPEPVISIGKKVSNFKPTKFSLENAPSDSIRGQITNMSGDIWRQSRTATEPAKLTEAVPIQQGEVLIASVSGKISVNFDPAVKLTLFPDTRVEIVQTLPLNLVFNQTRGVGQYLVTGQAPLTVRSLNLIVNLDDGLLVVDTDEEAGAIILGLKTGRAKVGYNSPGLESRVWELEPGDVFEFDSNEHLGYFK
jgi:hypothetical protein